MKKVEMRDIEDVIDFAHRGCNHITSLVARAESRGFADVTPRAALDAISALSALLRDAAGLVVLVAWAQPGRRSLMPKEPAVER